jgi:hypothetical protein
MKQDFKTWMKKVDAHLNKKCGLDHNCLADYCYWDAYDNGESPSKVARDVLEAEIYGR